MLSFGIGNLPFERSFKIQIFQRDFDDEIPRPGIETVGIFLSAQKVIVICLNNLLWLSLSIILHGCNCMFRVVAFALCIKYVKLIGLIFYGFEAGLQAFILFFDWYELRCIFFFFALTGCTSWIQEGAVLIILTPGN